MQEMLLTQTNSLSAGEQSRTSKTALQEGSGSSCSLHPTGFGTLWIRPESPKPRTPSTVGSPKGLIPTRGSCGMQQIMRTLMFCKIFCLFIFTVKTRTNFFQIPKAKPSYRWPCELCLKKSAKVGFISLKIITFIAFPLAKQT